MSTSATSNVTPIKKSASPEKKAHRRALELAHVEANRIHHAGRSIVYLTLAATVIGSGLYAVGSISAARQMPVTSVTVQAPTPAPAPVRAVGPVKAQRFAIVPVR